MPLYRGSCGHLKGSYDNHPSCITCTSCSRYSSCHICSLWDDNIWQLFASRRSSLSRKIARDRIMGKKETKKAKKGQKAFSRRSSKSGHVSDLVTEGEDSAESFLPYQDGGSSQEDSARKSSAQPPSGGSGHRSKSSNTSDQVSRGAKGSSAHLNDSTKLHSSTPTDPHTRGSAGKYGVHGEMASSHDTDRQALPSGHESPPVDQSLVAPVIIDDRSNSVTRSVSGYRSTSSHQSSRDRPVQHQATTAWTGHQSSVHHPTNGQVNTDRTSQISSDNRVESDKSDTRSRHRANVDHQSTSVGNQSFDQSTVVNHQSSVMDHQSSYVPSSPQHPRSVSEHRDSRDRPIQERPHQERSELQSNSLSAHTKHQSDRSFHQSDQSFQLDERINTLPSERRTGRTDVRPTISLRYTDSAELSPNTMLRSRQHRERSVSRTRSVRSRSRHHYRSSSSCSSHRRSRKKKSDRKKKKKKRKRSPSSSWSRSPSPSSDRSRHKHKRKHRRSRSKSKREHRHKSSRKRSYSSSYSNSSSEYRSKSPKRHRVVSPVRSSSPVRVVRNRSSRSHSPSVIPSPVKSNHDLDFSIHVRENEFDSASLVQNRDDSNRHSLNDQEKIQEEERMKFCQFIEEIYTFLPEDRFPRCTQDAEDYNPRPRSSIDLELEKTPRKSISLPQSTVVTGALNYVKRSLGAKAKENDPVPMPSSIPELNTGVQTKLLLINWLKPNFTSLITRVFPLILLLLLMRTHLELVLLLREMCLCLVRIWRFMRDNLER